MSHFVLLIHGIGRQKKRHLLAFQQRIEQAFRKEFPGHPDELVFRQAFWADVTQPDEDRLSEVMQKAGLRGLLRSFMTVFLGDAIAYSKLTSPHGSPDIPYTYDRIQEVFAQTLRELNDLATERPGSRLTVIAHSLGSVIASDGIYDLMKSDKFPPNLVLENLF